MRDIEVNNRRTIILKSVFKRKMFYREYLLTNVFNEEFDKVKRDSVKLEKFIKISGKDYFLTICKSHHKYFFMVIC